MVARSEMTRQGVVLAVQSELAAGRDSAIPEVEHAPEEEGVGTNATLGIRVADHILQTVGGKLEREVKSDSQVLRATLPIAEGSTRREAARAVAATVS